MTGTYQNIKEAAGSQPCRLHPTWVPGGKLDNYDTTTNTSLRITNSHSKTKQIAVQTEPSHNQLQKSVATQTDDLLLTFVPDEHNATTTSDCQQVQSSNNTDLDGFIRNSLEILDDITDTSRNIAKLTRDAETLFAKMPVGTNFEYSALKASFSLSSLQPSTCLESPEHAKIRNERPYNSLTKKRKDPKQENWRRSWGSSYETKDDFWSALQPNYDYIMDNHLIDSCLEIDRDIRCSRGEEIWNLNTFDAQFNELCTFLNNIQETVYGKTENITNWALRASHIEEMSRCSSRRDLFNEQANRLIDESGFQDEVSWRVSHLNSKWEQVESALSSNGCSECEEESCPDVKHEVKCLRKWMKEMESRLQPLNFQVEWTVAELEKKALEHSVLQRDIENHTKVVRSVVRLCKRGTPRDAKCRASNTLRVANGLERKYHLLFLRSLEWQCHIEGLVKRHNNRYQDLSSDADSDEEPCIKQPRLSSDYIPYNSPSQVEDDEIDLVSVSPTDMDISSEPVSVIKMVNERCSELNDTELDGFDPDNYKMGCNTCGTTEKQISPKHKNILQKLPTPIDLLNNSIIDLNVGAYCYEHGTDTEFETTKDLHEDNPQKSDSSEDEFTFSADTTHHLQESALPTNIHKTPDKESIHLLVQQVEELVAQPSRVDPLLFHTVQQKSKLFRVKEWLNDGNENEVKIDSCDASGECTSGDSEEEKESQSSEDFNNSIVTCRPHATIYDSRLPLDDSTSSVNCDGIPSVLSTPETIKVALRPKRLQLKGNRPWSVSCLSQLAHTSPVKHTNDALQNFSNSESALHKLGILSPSAVKMRTYAASTNSIGVQGNLSTSSTVEESGVMILNEGAKPLSTRKKKMRLRRKHMIRKNESGSESQSYKSPCHTSPYSSPTTKPNNLCCLVKSGSFSGSGSKTINNNERSTASDPSARPHNRTKGDTSTTSGADSEDDKKQLRFPKFLFGPHLGLVKGYCTIIQKTECRDSSPEKSSLNTAEEQSSSLSEQAWDNYQEKYLSENYSECHDSDAARRLLEFGEDYRCYLDSQSESAHSQNYEYSPQFRRKPMSPMPAGYADSDSEIDDIKQFINESKAQLKYTKDIYKQHVAMGFNEFLVSSDCGEIIFTCERHIYGLEVVIDTNDDTKVIHDNEVMEVKVLMSAWMDLKWSAKKMQSSRALYNEVITFKNDLSQYTVNPNPSSGEVKSKDQLTEEINKLTEVQNILQDKKRRLLELNVAVHRYIVSEDTPCYSNLKFEVSELYTLWNETCQNVKERLQNLTTHLQVWAQLESRLDKLQLDLRSDKETLQLLDTALQGGIVSMEVASSVRDVAKVLSESQPGTQKIAINGSGNNAVLYNGTLSLSLLTEGSFSDSGISDEGSEQELSEREHRLTAIRRLVRQLEAIMAPDSEARIKMTQRLEQAENELRKLQNQCRDLIVKTAVCAEVQSRGVSSQNGTKSISSRKQSTEAVAADKVCSPDEPEDDPYGGSWFWRVIRASMPFQVALVAIICMACLMEPSCCDSVNNLSLSWTPQLRYVRGPPPV